MNNGWEEDDDEDVLPPLEEDEEDDRPLFGCACQDPLTVDTVCEGCVAYLQEQHAEIERERIAKACAFTVEECVYWLAVLQLEARFFERATAAIGCILRRDVLRLEHIRSEARYFFADGAKRVTRWSAERSRENLVAWALCRAAIRAIERERGR